MVMLGPFTVPDVRTPEERYRIYALRGNELRLLATTPDAAGVGVALVQLHEDEKERGGRLSDLGFIGVLDGLAEEWVVLPWRRSHEASS